MKAGHSEERVIVGRNPVREALARDDGRVEKVLLQQGLTGRPAGEIRRLAREAGVPVQQVPSARLSRMAPGVAHQGVAALIVPVAYREVEEVLNEIAADTEVVRAKKPMVLLLDRIEDPHNFGAILRSALAAGVEGVIVPRRRMAPLNAAAVKASAGAALKIPIARAGNLADVIEQLKERGYWVAGAAGEGDTSVWEMDWDRPLAIVIGSEDRGIRPQIAKACDYLVAIPMRGPVESLNASVAAGILLFAAARSRSS